MLVITLSFCLSLRRRGLIICVFHVVTIPLYVLLCTLVFFLSFIIVDISHCCHARSTVQSFPKCHHSLVRSRMSTVCHLIDRIPCFFSVFSTLRLSSYLGSRNSNDSHKSISKTKIGITVTLTFFTKWNAIYGQRAWFPYRSYTGLVVSN